MRTPLAAALAIVLAFGCTDQPTTPTALNEAVPAPIFNAGHDHRSCDALEALLAVKQDRVSRLKSEAKRVSAEIDAQIRALQAEMKEVLNLPLPDIAVEVRIEALKRRIAILQDRADKRHTFFGAQVSAVNVEIKLIKVEIRERCLP